MFLLISPPKRIFTLDNKIRITTNKGPRSFKIAGIVVEFYGNMGEAIISSREDMKKYFGVDNIQSFRLKVKSKIKPESVARKITDIYGEKKGIKVQSNQQLKDEIDKEVNLSFAVFNILVFIAVIIATLGVINTLLVNILERIREIGLLRAVGTSRWQIKKMILAESILTGIIGAILGIVLGLFLSKEIVDAMHEYTGFHLTYIFPLSSITTSIIIALAISVLATLYPARRATQVDIVKQSHYTNAIPILDARCSIFFWNSYAL